MGAILCFHSITTRQVPAEGSAHVSLDAFRAFVRAAERVGTLVPLSELVRRHLDGRDTAGLVAITLDDAYAALHGEFRQVVAHEGIPVAIFVVTAAAASAVPFWWDRIDDVFPRVSPDRWKAFETACGLPDEYRRGQPQEYGPLRPLRQWLLARHAGRWPDEFEPDLSALEEEAGFRTLQRPMTFGEIADLAALPSVEIGVHTVSHPVLPLLDDDSLEQEIALSHAVVRERFSNVLPILAVPFGLYDERTLRIARSAGMSASLTLAGTLLNDRARPFGLPRFCITRDDRPAKLALRLLGLPDLMRRWSAQPPAPYPDLPSATT